MEYIKFIKLAKRRFIGREQKDWTHYLEFQKFQAEEIIKEIKKRKIKLSNMKVLELGSGKGGYSQVFKKHFKTLVMGDLYKPFIMKLDPSFNFKRFDINKKYPLKDNEFDFVFSCSLIEHVKDTDNMISEIKRVLKPKGYLYLSFPPFYSPVGGHNVKPFHFFGEKIAIKITNFLKKKDYKNYETFWGDFGLHRRTIRGVKKLFFKHGFHIEDEWTRFSFINTTRIPILNEFLTWHVCFLCKNRKK